METPSSLFADILGIDGAFDEGRKAPTLDQGYPMFAEAAVKREVPFSPSLKMTMPRGLGGWDGTTEEEIGAADADMLQTQHMFVRPAGLFTQDDSDTLMALQDRPSKTPSVTPERLTRTTRLSTSRKTTSSLNSDSALSSNSLTSAATDISAPDPEPPKKRARAGKKVKKEAPEDDKRNKFLERNRIAASKCREKKKEFVSNLEERKTSLEKKHAQLQMEYNSLITEVGGLKHDLMTHAKCNDHNIDKWIANEARRFVQTSDIFGHRAAAEAAAAAAAAAPATATQGGQGQQRENNPFAHTHMQTHTRQSSAASSVQPHGLGSFSSAGGRRDSMAYSQASSAQTSSTDMAFPKLASPKFGSDMMEGMNFDHMPDDMFEREP